MAASATKMPPAKVPASFPTPPAPPTEGELRAAFKLRGGRILDSIDTQIRNASNLVKTKKAAGSDAQRTAYRAALKERATMLLSLSEEKPVAQRTEIPDA